MVRGAWQAIFHVVSRVRQDLATKPPPSWYYSEEKREERWQTESWVCKAMKLKMLQHVVFITFSKDHTCLTGEWTRWKMIWLHSFDKSGQKEGKQNTREMRELKSYAFPLFCFSFLFWFKQEEGQLLALLVLESYENESESWSVKSDSLRPYGLYSPWNSPGQSTGVGSLSLLQGIFPTQVSCIAGGFCTSWAITEAQEYWSG